MKRTAIVDTVVTTSYEFTEEDIIELLINACGLDKAEVDFDIRQGGGFLSGATVTATSATTERQQ